MYSPDTAGVNNPDGGNTTNDSLTGVGIGYKTGDLVLGGAYEKQEDIGNAAGKNASAYRIGAKYKTGPWQFGGIYETLSNDGYGKVIEHNGFGANLAYKWEDYTFAGQYFHAGASDVGNDAASQYSAGVYYDIAKPAQIYAAYSTIDNDGGASYTMGLGGHGQSYAPTKAGETVSVMSVGMIYSF